MAQSKSEKQKKEEFILDFVKKHPEALASNIEAAMKSAGFKVASRFRQETHNLINNGQLTRTGSGDKAVFSLTKAGRAKKAAAKVSKATTKPISNSPAAAIPVTDKTVKFSKAQEREIVSPVLKYLATNGDRSVDAIVRKAFPDSVLTIDIVVTIAAMYELRHITRSQNEYDRMVITKAGRACLDSVLAGGRSR